VVFLQGLAVIIFIAAIVFLPLFGLYYLVKGLISFFDRSAFGHKIDLRYAELLLSSKFVYYQKLDDKNKTRFMRRLLNFIENKDFKGSGGLQLTDEMIVLISASAIQLTFGLDEYMLDHFSKIFVYPKAYYSKVSGQYHKGETNLGGAIALSWNHFTEGYNKPSDKVNLGLHEMAHALRFDKFKSNDYDKFFNQYFDKWQVIASEEYKKTKENASPFFREYGGTNMNEFFAVCVESFFESPAEFKKLHPEIYKHMCILLNQDPLADAFSKRRDIRTMHPEYVNISGEAFYVSGNNGKNILALIFAVILWGSMVLKDIKSGGSLDVLVFAVVMLIVGYFITLRAFSKVYFYDTGIVIKSWLPNLIDKKNEFSYDELICVEFIQRPSDETTDTIRILFLSGGKIRTRSFSDVFSPDDVLRFADILRSKKVAVKLNEFYRHRKN
jgi:Mlc titration factor MtfA (ptsG expression regulator)